MTILKNFQQSNLRQARDSREYYSVGWMRLQLYDPSKEKSSGLVSNNPIQAQHKLEGSCVILSLKQRRATERPLFNISAIIFKPSNKGFPTEITVATITVATITSGKSLEL